MKLLRVFLIASLLAAGFVFLPALPTASADCVNLSGNGDTDLWIGPFSMPAGSSITVTMNTTDGDGTAILVFVDGTLVLESVEFAAQQTVTYDFPSQTDNIELLLDWQFNGQPENSYRVTSTDCGVLPNIPEQAVSGTFVQDAELYWEPGMLIEPYTVVEAGKTYLVAGQDESGMYRKVLIACTWVWVRAETIGPNYDEVWNGMPLPTTVVEAGDSNACGAPGVSNVPVEPAEGIDGEPELPPELIIVE